MKRGQNQGLADTLLGEDEDVSHVRITGTLEYDCSYIKNSLTPTRCKIIFITNRQIRFGEAFFDAPLSPGHSAA